MLSPKDEEWTLAGDAHGRLIAVRVTPPEEHAKCYCYHCRRQIVDFVEDPDAFAVMPDHELLFFCRECRVSHLPTYRALRALEQ
jgi:hypothetical protein